MLSAVEYRRQRTDIRSRHGRIQGTVPACSYRSRTKPRKAYWFIPYFCRDSTRKPRNQWRQFRSSRQLAVPFIGSYTMLCYTFLHLLFVFVCSTEWKGGGRREKGVKARKHGMFYALMRPVWNWMNNVRHAVSLRKIPWRYIIIIII